MRRQWTLDSSEGISALSHGFLHGSVEHSCGCEVSQLLCFDDLIEIHPLGFFRYEKMRVLRSENGFFA